MAEQAALELADTNVGVTGLCPALVRTGMSDQGEGPHDIAVLALAAVNEGPFAVLPDEWTAAIKKRAETLISGRSPETPRPT